MFCIWFAELSWTLVRVWHRLCMYLKGLLGKQEISLMANSLAIPIKHQHVFPWHKGIWSLKKELSNVSNMKWRWKDVIWWRKLLLFLRYKHPKNANIRTIHVFQRVVLSMPLELILYLKSIKKCLGKD